MEKNPTSANYSCCLKPFTRGRGQITCILGRARFHAKCLGLSSSLPNSYHCVSFTERSLSFDNPYPPAFTLNSASQQSQSLFQKSASSHQTHTHITTSPAHSTIILSANSPSTPTPSHSSRSKRTRELSTSPPDIAHQLTKILRVTSPRTIRHNMSHVNLSASGLSPDSFLLWNLIEKKFDDLGQSMNTRLTTVENSVSEIGSKVEQLKSNRVLSDDCELRFIGIPENALDNAEEMIKAVKRILKVIKLPLVASALIDVRIWDPPKQTDNSNTSKPANSFIAEFSSPVVRDQILKVAPHLKNHSSQTMFTSGNNTKLFIRPLYPALISSLLYKARAHAKSINYWPLIVQNLTIFMRMNHGSSLIPIHHESDLLALSPNPAVCPSRNLNSNTAE